MIYRFEFHSAVYLLIKPIIFTVVNKLYLLKSTSMIILFFDWSDNVRIFYVRVVVMHFKLLLINCPLSRLQLHN